MIFKTSVRVVLWSALVGTLVAGGTYLLLDWMMPGEVTIGPLASGEIVVDVRGAVANPGVVRLPAGSRLQAAIREAGGLSEEADVASLNLAGRLGDGEQVTIPSEPDPSTAAVPSPTLATGVSTQLIDINTASAAELEQLPDIGPAIAQRIIDFREANGPFQSIQELDQIEGISPEMVEGLQPLITTGE